MAGNTPKAIARSLGIRPAVVSPLLRRLAADQEEQRRAEGHGPALVGCWVNAGWAEELEMTGHPEWPRGGPSDGCAGLASVVIARRDRGARVSACSILVDTHCLGVKEVIGPLVMLEEKLAVFIREIYGGYNGPPLKAPLDLAQHLVLGAVEYAGRLGFEPASDFVGCLGHLGTWLGPSAIGFGRHGRPMYVAGPYDDPLAVIEALEGSVGLGGFDVVMGLPT
ncbi:MAG: hypothetical protein ACYCUI_15905 [Vulcanimicrobiaceae bacterium]